MHCGGGILSHPNLSNPPLGIDSLLGIYNFPMWRVMAARAKLFNPDFAIEHIQQV